MKDPFYRQYSDGTEFTYKHMGVALAIGAVGAMVLAPIMIAWQEREVTKVRVKRWLAKRADKK